MDFCNKIDFLMKLTHLKNKELAAEIAVDRSLISLLRTGKRGMPKNKLHIKRMAESFAKRFTTDYQRQALAEISGLSGMRAEVSPEILAVQIERWLHGDIDLVDHILDGMEQEAPDPLEFTPPKIAAPEGETFFFYGEKGKREALRLLIGIIGEGMIGIYDNSDLNWLMSEPSLADEVQVLISKHISSGGTLTQILPPISNINCYTDSLHFLLPLYIRGNANIFYYPRIMEAGGNVTTVIAPGQCVLFSYGYSRNSNNMITIVSTNKQFINAHAEQFNEFRSLCRSALTVHRKPQEFFDMTMDFFAVHGDICQKIQPLSTSSMSAELAEIFAEQCEDFIWREAFRKVAAVIPSLEQRLANYCHIDICPLSSVRDIVAGKVSVASPHPNKNHPCYTPETYIMHLKNILRLMETYERYTFIAISPDSYQGYNLMVNDGGTALLSQGVKNSPMIMEFNRPEIVLACKEHLMRIVDREGGIEAARSKSRAKLTALIGELQKAAKRNYGK